MRALLREHVLLFSLLGLVLTATIILAIAPGAVTWELPLIDWADAGARFEIALFGQPAKCEVAHTSPPIIPYKNPATWNQEGTHGTKTSYRRDCSCNGADHPNGHDVGRVADLPASTFAFVLGRSTSFLPPTLDAAGVLPPLAPEAPH